MTNELAAETAVPAMSDDAAIRGVIDDYYLGWFDADAVRMARALHPALVKHGWLRDETGELSLELDTRDSMVALAGDGRGRRTDPVERAFEISFIEVYSDIAAATVHAWPYVDYLQLIRTSDGWRIVHALWCPA
jgi:hypothetical protein